MSPDRFELSRIMLARLRRRDSRSMGVVRNHLLGNPTPEEEKQKLPRWKKEQLWQVMLQLADAKSGEIGYDHVLFNVFKGDDATFRSLARVDLIRSAFVSCAAAVGCH